MCWVVISYVFGEVHIACDMRVTVPFVEKTFKDESGFANSTRPMENEGLMDAVLLGMVAEDSLHERPGNNFPGLVYHLRFLVLQKYSASFFLMGMPIHSYETL